MLFGYPMGVQGNMVSAGVNEFIIPNYKQTWGKYPKISGAPERYPPSVFQIPRISSANLGRSIP